MSLLDKFFNYLGYTKVVKAQSNSNDYNAYPSNEKFPQNNEDAERQKLLDQNTPQNEVAQPGISGHPEQLAGAPGVNNNQSDVQHYGNEGTQVPTNFNRDTQNTGGGTTQPNVDVNETGLKNRLMMDIDEVDQQNHAIAVKMKKANILTINRELFNAKMEDIQRKAALRKQSISEYLDEIL